MVREIPVVVRETKKQTDEVGS